MAGYFYCAVPGCYEFCKTNNVTREHSFILPKDEIVRQQWLKILTELGVSLSKTLRVCERHFKDDELVNGETFEVDGIEQFLPFTSKRVHIKSGAYPTQNLQLIEVDIQPKSITAELPVEQDPVDEEMDMETAANRTYDVIDISDHSAEADQVVDVAVDEVKIFDDLYDGTITLPSTSWGTSRDPNRKWIVFLAMNPDDMTQPRMLINIDNTLEVRLNGEQLTDIAVEDLNVDGLTKVLSELEMKN